MSPDDIFAAQFWPWPDPAIKRDNQGRVLFVNAAFLQLYGGTVQDWTGNVVGGWPTPQGPGQAYRFETRMPAAGGAEEQVYDWMEMTLADGHAFALARNVTIFTQVSAPQPDISVPQMPDSQIAESQMVQSQVAQSQVAQSQVAQSQTRESTAPTPNSDVMVVQSFEPVNEAMPANNMAEFQTPSSDVLPDTQPHVMDENLSAAQPLAQGQDLTQQLTEQASQAASHEPVVFAEYTPEEDVIAQAPATAQPVQEVAAPEAQAPVQTQTPDIPAETDGSSDRAYERRALPIEESAVLGNNWRDAVIAKAVGAQPAPDPTPDLAPSNNAANIDEQPNGPKRILLAEDNAINALLTRTLLEAEGHTVETVQDGQLAVEAMKTASYDLIFMDMRMPNMDGLEATRKIRTLPNVSKNLPIIALTANAFDDDRNACFDSGMNDFMTKPVSAEELSEMVSQWTKPKEGRMAS